MYFLSTDFFFKFLLEHRELSFDNLIVTEVSRNFRNIYLSKIPRSLKVEVRLISSKKVFPKMAKMGNFVISELIIYEVLANLENFFFSFGREVGHSPITLQVSPLRVRTSVVLRSYLSAQRR